MSPADISSGPQRVRRSVQVQSAPRPVWVASVTTVDTGAPRFATSTAAPGVLTAIRGTAILPTFVLSSGLDRADVLRCACRRRPAIWKL